MAVINTNPLALAAQNNMARSQGALNTAVQRLSSGLRINSAMDDAAGLAIANRMTAQIRGLSQAARNAGDGISMTQTADGALAEVSNNLQRIRELTVQGKNPTNGPSDVASLQKEINDRLAEIDRVASTFDFNGVKPFTNPAGVNISLQVGANDGETISFTIGGTSTGDLSMNSFAITSGSIATVDAAIAEIDALRSGLGAVQNRVQSVINTIQTTVVNLSAARSRIEDADYATEVAALTRAQILQQAGSSVLGQAITLPQNVLSLLR